MSRLASKVSRAAGVVDNGRPIAAGDSEDFGHRVRCLVERESVRRAQLPRGGRLLRGGGERHDLGARRRGELHDSAARGARGGLDDDRVPEDRLGRLARQHVRGRATHRDRCCNIERHVQWERDHVRRADRGQLGIDAGHVAEVHDGTADERRIGVGAGRDDLACRLDAGDQGQLHRVGPTLAMLDVDVVDPDPAVANQHLVAYRGRLRTLDCAQLLGPAVPGDLDRLHGHPYTVASSPPTARPRWSP
jgi:hypothetical protein